jgi:hypothetical protein
MLIARSAVGLFVGVLAAGASLLLGFSIWSALGFYILGGSLGVGLSLTPMLLRRPTTMTEEAQGRAVAAKGEYQAS